MASFGAAPLLLTRFASHWRAHSHTYTVTFSSITFKKTHKNWTYPSGVPRIPGQGSFEQRIATVVVAADHDHSGRCRVGRRKVQAGARAPPICCRRRRRRRRHRHTLVSAVGVFGPTHPRTLTHTQTRTHTPTAIATGRRTPGRAPSSTNQQQHVVEPAAASTSLLHLL